MPMHYLAQQTPTTCGQTCVAMIAGLSWSEGVAVVGKRGITNYKHLVAALNNVGYTTGPVTRISKRNRLPSTGTALVMLRWRGRNYGHWVVLHEGAVYDPTWGAFDGESYFDSPDAGKPTSFVTVSTVALYTA